MLLRDIVTNGNKGDEFQGSIFALLITVLSEMQTEVSVQLLFGRTADETLVRKEGRSKKKMGYKIWSSHWDKT